MRRLVMVLVVGAVLFGLVGAAAAEGGSIVPWSKAASFGGRPLANSTIWPD